ncbi:MAG: glycosyltransferase [Paludibacteraceae bacterium]|nr:glycosyltransferase [Paludibacteraceae bacterium]
MAFTPLNITLGITALSLLIILIHYFVHYTAILRVSRRERKGRVVYNTERPKVSVIIVTRNLDEELESYLPLILEQTYPDYEVILVDDGSWDNTEDVVRRLRETYPHLYMTTIPKKSRIVSHRKLAITVGAKAAKGDILLLTEPTARPFSNRWIESMVRNFVTGVEFVTGNCVMLDNSGFLQHMIAYDTLTNTMRATGFAVMGHPYSATSKNMAYLRSTFFKNDGFAGLLHQEFGDDDLMVNRHGNGLNTKAEPTRSAHTICIDKPSYREWRFMKKMQLSTLCDYRTSSLFSLFTEHVFRAIYYMSSIASIVLLLFLRPEWMLVGLEVLAGAYLLKSIVLLSVVNATAAIYKQRKFWLSALFFDIYLPLASLCINVFTRLPKNRF